MFTSILRHVYILQRRIKDVYTQIKHALSIGTIPKSISFKLVELLTSKGKKSRKSLGGGGICSGN
jgi:hypothetical protein